MSSICHAKSDRWGWNMYVCVCVCVCVWVYTYTTSDTRQVGWEKTSLPVSYFFPEHEEIDPQVWSLLVFLAQQYKYWHRQQKFGVVTWTEGWHRNFERLAGTKVPILLYLLVQEYKYWHLRSCMPGRLVVPPVVRTLIYKQVLKYLTLGTKISNFTH